MFVGSDRERGRFFGLSNQLEFTDIQLLAGSPSQGPIGNRPWVNERGNDCEGDGEPIRICMFRSINRRQGMADLQVEGARNDGGSRVLII